MQLEQKSVYIFEDSSGGLTMVKDSGNGKFRGFTEFEELTNPDPMGDVMTFFDSTPEELLKDWSLTPIEYDHNDLVKKIKPDEFNIVGKYDGHKLELYPNDMQTSAMIYFRVPNV